MNRQSITATVGLVFLVSLPIVLPGQDREPNDPLERTVSGMTEAGERLARRDTGRDTQEIQQQVLADLDALIEQAQRQPMSGSAGRQPRPNTSGPRSSGNRPGQADPSRPGGQPGQPGAGRRTRRPVRVELVRERTAPGGPWGHLPPAVRARLLSPRQERPLPAYADLVRRYYEALARDNDRSR